MPTTLPSSLMSPTMSDHDPCSEAEWILETIIDDFAESLDKQDRVRFYVRLAELIVERRDRMERILDDSEPEAGSSSHIH